MNEPRGSVWKVVVASIITAAVSASLSYAAAEARMCGEVRDDNIKLKVQMAAAQDELKTLRSLMERVIQQESELITLLRVQNQLKQP